MKQVFKTLAALCAGVMTLCAVSCEDLEQFDKPLDDGNDQKYENLQDQVNDLTDRVTALEALKKQLTDLATKVDGALYTIQFQVSDANELQYSFDGGKTWKGTGIILAEECECEPGAATPIDPCTCPEVSIKDNGGSVTITIGDQSFDIEKPQEIVFELKSGKLYFASEDTKTVNVVTSGIDDLTVMAAPKGWDADFNADGQLEITAPSVDNVTIVDPYGGYVIQEGEADASGYVKVHACSVEGKCMVGKLYVEVSEEPIVVNLYGGKYEVTTTGVAVYYGVSVRSELEADIKEFLEAYEASDYNFSWDYVASPYDDPAAGDLKDLLGADPVAGTEYVLWAIEYQSLDGATLEDFFLAYYTPVAVAVTEDESKRSAFDIQVKVEVVGASSYLAMAAPEDEADYLLETLLMEVSGEGGGGWGPMPMATKAVESSFAKTYEATYEGSLALLGVESISIAPGAKYVVIVLPLDGRPVNMYTLDDFVTKTFTSKELTAGGSVEAVFEQFTEYIPYEGASLTELDPYSELGVKVTPSSDNWKMFYGQWVTETVYAEDLMNGDPESVVAYLTDPSNYYADAFDNNKNFSGYMYTAGLDPEETRIYVGFFIDNDDKYGTIAMKSLTTAELVWGEILIAPTTNVVDGVIKNSNTLEVTLNPTGTATMYKYVVVETTYYNGYDGMTDEEVAEALHFSYDAVEVAAADVKDGILKIGDLAYGVPYYVAVLPYDAAGPGIAAYFVEFDCVFELDNVITDALVSEPTVTFNMPEMCSYEEYQEIPYGTPAYAAYVSEWGNYFYYDATYTVSGVGEGVEVITLMAEDSELTGTDLQLASGLWGGFLLPYNTKKGAGTFNRNFSGSDEAAVSPSILVTWKVGGNYYFKKISLATQYKTMYDNLVASIATPEEAPLPDVLQK